MVGLYLAVTLRASSAVGVVMLVTSLCADIYCCLERRVFIVYFFFFQAEDGIRDKLVTGVQTCALPIWDHRQAAGCRGGRPGRVLEGDQQDRHLSGGCGAEIMDLPNHGERRIPKAPQRRAST